MFCFFFKCIFIVFMEIKKFDLDFDGTTFHYLAIQAATRTVPF